MKSRANQTRPDQEKKNSIRILPNASPSTASPARGSTEGVRRAAHPSAQVHGLLPQQLPFQQPSLPSPWDPSLPRDGPAWAGARAGEEAQQVLLRGEVSPSQSPRSSVPLGVGRTRIQRPEEKPRVGTALRVRSLRGPEAEFPLGEGVPVSLSCCRQRSISSPCGEQQG